MMRANRMGRRQGLDLYRAHFLEMHLDNPSMDGTRDDFYLVRTLVHISHGSCTEHHTHMDLPPSQSGSHLFSLLPLSCHGTMTPGTAVLHVFQVAHGGESGHTLWLTLLKGHTFHLPRH